MRWKSRGFTTIEEVIKANHPEMTLQEFLHPRDDYQIKNIPEMANFILKAKEDQKNITIIGDYDADGVCSTKELCMLLEALGISPNVRLPRRFSEGYGLSEKIIDEIDDGVIITVDNGIAAGESIEKAKKKGLSVGIIDHHLNLIDERNLPVIPNADVIIDPNVEGFGGDFNGYCASGLVYKLAQYMKVDEKALDGILCYAAIGTVADVMDLIEDNRNIVIKGLKVINDFHNRPMAIGALMKQMYIGTMTESDIGFRIGPVINASGRLYDDGAQRVLDYFMMNENFPDLLREAEKLVQTNQERKRIVTEAMEEAEDYIKENCMFGERPLVLNLDANEGVLGIVAGRLSERYQTPAFVLTEHEPGMLKGSGRTYGNIHLKNLMDACAEYLIKYGGHAGAGGLSMKEEHLMDFQMAASDFLEEQPEQINNERYYDLEVSQDDDFDEILQKLHQFAPFGQGNPPVTFLIKGFKLSPVGGSFYEAFGDMNDPHLKFHGKSMNVIGYNMYRRFQEQQHPVVLDIYGKLRPGRKGGQFELEDFTPVVSKKKESALSKALAEELMKF